MLNFFRRKKPEPIVEAVVVPEQKTVIEPIVAEPAAVVSKPREPEVEPSSAFTFDWDEAIANANLLPEPVVLEDESVDAATEVLVDKMVESPEFAPVPTNDAQTDRGWFSRLKQGLAKTGKGIKHVFIGHKVDEALFEELEDALLMADVGLKATTQILTAVRARVKKERIDTAQGVKQAVKFEMVELLRPLEKELDVSAYSPLVMMVAGVNGAGKTTSIGKLTHHLQASGKTIILAAGDTFRAAAREQLAVWGQRNGVTVIAQESGDPAAVVFDAIASAQAKKIDVVIADTAGRLPTQLNLMDELKKVKRVAGKGLEGAPHEVILVLDGSMGQNAIAQVKAFDEAVGLTGLIVTKLDGSAKGGVLAALAVDRVIPVYFIGVGEGVHDLQTFDAEEFVDALLD